MTSPKLSNLERKLMLSILLAAQARAEGQTISIAEAVRRATRATRTKRGRK